MNRTRHFTYCVRACLVSCVFFFYGRVMCVFCFLLPEGGVFSLEEEEVSPANKPSRHSACKVREYARTYRSMDAGS